MVGKVHSLTVHAEDKLQTVRATREKTQIDTAQSRPVPEHVREARKCTHKKAGAHYTGGIIVSKGADSDEEQLQNDQRSHEARRLATPTR